MAWKATGMESKYGRYCSTYNRKLIATIMARDHPEMQEVTAKVLKHSKATERTYYDFGKAPGQAVTVRTFMSKKSHNLASPPLPLRNVPLNQPTCPWNICPKTWCPL